MISLAARRRLQQVQITREVRPTQRDAARLPRPGELAHPALLQVELRDREAIRRLGECLQAGPRLRHPREQGAMTRGGPTTPAPALLVGLGGAAALPTTDPHL